MVSPNKIVIPAKVELEKAAKLASIIGDWYTARDLGLPLLALIARGGWHIGEVIVDELGIGITSVVSMSLERINNGNKQSLRERFNHGQIPTQEQVAGRHVLIVDDAYRTGSTLEYAHHLVAELRPLSVKSAVVYISHPGSDETSSYRPDFYAELDPYIGHITTREFKEEIVSANAPPGA
ncbi:MAG: phosphoribosyltransferase [Candidatus Saccharimonadales bacterium]